MKIAIDCTEEQAKLIETSLEEYFRIRMGQTNYLADGLADDTYKYDPKDPDGEKKFAETLQRRDSLRAVLDAAVVIAYGQYHSCVSENARNASDIWIVLRYELYMSDPDNVKHRGDIRGNTPFRTGTLPLPKIEVER